MNSWKQMKTLGNDLGVQRNGFVKQRFQWRYGSKSLTVKACHVIPFVSQRWKSKMKITSLNLTFSRTITRQI